jgi:LacI family transcriptional regulator
MRMADVAATAGVGLADVARTMAGDTRVPREVSERVEAAMESMDYRPLEARRIELNRPLRLAIVFKTYLGDDPGSNHFYTPMASVLAVDCASMGAEIRHATMAVDEQCQLLAIPPALQSGAFDGAFLMGAQLNARRIEDFRSIGCPVVLMDGYSEGDAVDSVRVDNAYGARVAVDRLVSAGHRDIAIIGSETSSFPSIRDRRSGYLQAIETHGLRKHLVDASYVLPEAAAALAVDYLWRHPEVTAAFCVNDLIAIAFEHAAEQAGIGVPADVSLVGFDNIDLAGPVVETLTTLGVDKGQMGHAGFALMAHRLEVPEAEALGILQRPALVERHSVSDPQPR